MKKKINFAKSDGSEDMPSLDYDDYADMFEGGMTDSEISGELGVDEKYVKKIRKEYFNDF
ncbi:MAG: hypothetical protein QME45_08285 [Clostridiales bacterium]|nr:hypothetical protein [Clostridiales bacterium]HBM81954.1 hypothetical protein [Clostridiaceae bacterium]